MTEIALSLGKIGHSMTEEHLSESNRKRVLNFYVERFRRAAIVTHFGQIDEDKAMQNAGMKAAKRIVDDLDVLGPEGREALIPLLDDSDWDVGACAAAYLLKVKPRQAVAALENIRTHGPTPDVRMDAFLILRSFERGEQG
jgi:hypothetical protein